ncbi:N-acylphosphatidylethanolamine synthase isoform X6 [Vitis vinifera]|uniref:N-acylphosphatidylethanolamine synthase isoform X6 n=1 Tax=Vitis vinifera TaxID=29760 RepID=UPI0028833B2D|nr:N-acylphosphatidylethanolamine synthase isoform X6 [Vitis vinifera]
MRKMEWAGRPNHIGGIPRRIVFMAVGAFAKAVASLFNSTSVQNADTLIRLVRSRPPGIPLITVSNHMSTLDDPVMWGFKGFPSMDAKLARWVLAAEDICFKNALLSYFFRLGKCIPITRGAGIYQEHMNEALERLSDGAWVCHASRSGHLCCKNCSEPVIGTCLDFHGLFPISYHQKDSMLVMPINYDISFFTWSLILQNHRSTCCIHFQREKCPRKIHLLDD